MSGSHFYVWITLPGNASLDVFPNNKTTEYHVKLPQTVNLEGECIPFLTRTHGIPYGISWRTHIFTGTMVVVFIQQ